MKIRALAIAAMFICLGVTPPMVMAVAPVSGTAMELPRAARQASSDKVHQATGQVLAVSANSLLLLHSYFRSKRQMAFTLTAQTDQEIKPVKGERIVVLYRNEGGHMIVTEIRAPRTTFKEHQATGSVLAVSSGSLVILHSYYKSHPRMTFTMTPQTRQDVTPVKGERIVVDYRDEGGRMIAIRIHKASPRHSRRSARAK